MRWIRLEVTWEESEWLENLDGPTRACWPRLLCIVKRDGVRGRCRRPSTRKLAERWGVTPRDVEALEAAAIADEALDIKDGCWVVLNWSKYQEPDPTAAERKRRQRERERIANGLTVIEGGRDERESRRDTA